MATETIVTSGITNNANFKLLKITGDFTTIAYLVGVSNDNTLISYEITPNGGSIAVASKQQSKY
jgi:hypothetical protein